MRRTHVGNSTGRGKIKAVIVVCILTLALAAGVLFLNKDRLSVRDGNNSRPAADMAGMAQENAGMVTASGTTTVGMKEETFTIGNLETNLTIEEVYVAGGDEVEAGAAVLKVSEDCISAARRELEKAAAQAELNYRRQELTSQEERITAKQTLDTDTANGKYAQYIYESSMKEYEDAVTDLEEQIKKAEELVAEYTDSIENDYYSTYYQVAQKKESYETNFQKLMNLYEEWDVAWLEDQYGNTVNNASGGSTSSGSATGSTVQVSQADASGEGGASGMGGAGKTEGGLDNNATKLTAYNLFDEEVQENKEEYEEAAENYEAAKKKAESCLLQEKSNLELLKLELEEAKVEYDKQKVSCKSVYDSTVQESQDAQAVYDAELNRIEEELEVAKNAMEEAQEELQSFEDTIGDGYFYTESSGSIKMVSVRAGSNLESDIPVVVYADPSKLSVTASVDQSDIASIEVGEAATVMMEDYGAFEGHVTQINPVSLSDGKTNVYYSVIITLDSDTGSLRENLTGTVIFGEKEEETGESEAAR